MEIIYIFIVNLLNKEDDRATTLLSYVKSKLDIFEIEQDLIFFFINLINDKNI